MDTERKVDVLEYATGLLWQVIEGDKYISKTGASADDQAIIISAAVLAVAAELRDIHNVLHEINQHAGALLALAQGDDSYTVAGEEVKW